MDIEKVLIDGQTTGDSMIQAVLIICVLVFIVWNIKLALE